MARADQIESAYRARVRALLDVMAARLEGEYGRRVNLADVDRTFAAFAPQAAALIEQAQASGVSFTLGYMRQMLTERAGRLIEPAPLRFSPVGLTEKGRPLLEGMAAIPALVKAEIGKGRPLQEIRDYGSFLIRRFGDAETTRAIEAAADLVARDTPEVIGWEGVVSAAACGPCRGNAGRHSLNQQMYRHGGCDCVKQYVVEAA